MKENSEEILKPKVIFAYHSSDLLITYYIKVCWMVSNNDVLNNWTPRLLKKLS